MAKTQKNKATSYHLGQLKAKLAKLKRELLTPSSSGGGGGAGFDVARTGVASVYVSMRFIYMADADFFLADLLGFLLWVRVL